MTLCSTMEWNQQSIRLKKEKNKKILKKVGKEWECRFPIKDVNYQSKIQEGIIINYHLNLSQSMQTTDYILLIHTLTNIKNC